MQYNHRKKEERCVRRRVFSRQDNILQVYLLKATIVEQNMIKLLHSLYSPAHSETKHLLNEKNPLEYFSYISQISVVPKFMHVLYLIE